MSAKLCLTVALGVPLMQASGVVAFSRHKGGITRCTMAVCVVLHTSPNKYASGCRTVVCFESMVHRQF